MATGEAVKAEKCGCCGLWEECTMGYIGCVQERYGGVWVCGLCEEAIKDEQARLGVGVGVEVALKIHATFRETANANPTPYVTDSIMQLIKKIISSSSSSSQASPSNVSLPYSSFSSNLTEKSRRFYM
ncbi:hypothetical protein FEM48_Zijuj05G0168700 [Ziziphus jujuba var. spinosa]|uniref:Uncharacterized protein n=1 Tax=Ziziphus jujuba var. spinosa TaxID=714518 RepID=A0A978VG00_ZIZJJ|nr:hypothetical protein FEM48_Zijuj05G0168700 [Ziziphus jujuba var. spinosa]